MGGEDWGIDGDAPVEDPWEDPWPMMPDPGMEPTA